MGGMLSLLCTGILTECETEPLAGIKIIPNMMVFSHGISQSMALLPVTANVRQLLMVSQSVIMPGIALREALGQAGTRHLPVVQCAVARTIWRSIPASPSIAPQRHAILSLTAPIPYAPAFASPAKAGAYIYTFSCQPVHKLSKYFRQHAAQTCKFTKIGRQN